VEHYQEGQKIMNIKEIEELALLLEGENPSSHGEWLRLRADALTALTWWATCHAREPARG